jgi:hypothetical protein
VRLTILKKHNAEIHAQSALDAALDIRARPHFAVDAVRSVRLKTFRVAHQIIGGGEEGDKRIVRTKEDADHSLPSCWRSHSLTARYSRSSTHPIASRRRRCAATAAQGDRYAGIVAVGAISATAAHRARSIYTGRILKGEKLRAPLRVVAWTLLLLVGLAVPDVAPLADGVGSHDQPDQHCQGATWRQGE